MRGSKPSCLSYDEQVRFEGKVKIHSKMFKRTREVRVVCSSVERRRLRAGAD